MSDWADIPLRMCVDRVLPTELHGIAGKIAVAERPRDALLLRPEDFLPPDLLNQMDHPEQVLYQRLGVDRRALWEPGRTISIGFYPDAPAGTPSQIMTILEQNCQHGNLSFRQVPVDQAELRIGFRVGGGLWHYIGSQSLTIRQGPTGNLGDIQWSNPQDIYRVVSHEICPGHACGAEHAVTLPDAGNFVRLNKPAIIAYYQRTQGWSYEQAAFQFELPPGTQILGGAGSRDSIMWYEIPPQFTTDGVGIPFNWKPDATDWEGFSKFYPGRDTPVTTPGPSPPPTPTPPVGPPPVNPAEQLTWGRIVRQAYQPAGVHMFWFQVSRETNATLKVQDLEPQGNPFVDIIPSGSTPVRLVPQPGHRDDVVLFPFHLQGAGRYTLMVQFRGTPPSDFKVQLVKG